MKRVYNFRGSGTNDVGAMVKRLAIAQEKNYSQMTEELLARYAEGSPEDRVKGYRRGEERTQGKPVGFGVYIEEDIYKAAKARATRERVPMVRVLRALAQRSLEMEQGT